MSADAMHRRMRRRPGSSRSQLVAKYHARGHRLFNLWYQYSPKLDRDIILSSDAAFDHFCWLEGDPNVRTYALDPQPLSLCVDDQLMDACFDVRVELRVGRAQLRDLDSRCDGETQSTEAKRSLAQQAGFEYLRVDRSLLRQHHQLIANWRRALSFIAAARDHQLSSFHNDLSGAMRHEPSMTIGGLLLHTEDEAQSLMLATIFRALQEGWLQSNMDEAALSRSTRIYRPEHAYEQ